MSKKETESSNIFKMREATEEEREAIDRYIQKISYKGTMGWICPVCGRGLSPFTMVCPCHNKGIGINYEVTC